jgi:glycosyltransferase involved in cell wall biosynthesis
VGFAGQWVPEKGLQVLLTAWPLVEQKVNSAELLLAGGPTLWKRTNPAPGAQELAEQVARMCSLYHTIVEMGIVPRQEMPTFWRQIHVAVVPSVWAEPFGLTALEAMACGRPVVASAVGALPEVVGDAGILVPPGDPIALADALVELLLDMKKMEELGTRAVARAQIFSVEKRAQRLVELIREVAYNANLQPR